jgi:hypothetical protein
METTRAKRLAKLAAKKIGNSVKVEHYVWFHPKNNKFDIDKVTNGYKVAYFAPECIQKDFDTWAETEAFLKQLALKGLPNV